MANQRKPDNLHLLEGTFRKGRHGDPDKKLKVSTPFPVCPSWMPEDAKTEWARIKKLLEVSKVITGCDSAILTQYCLLYADMKELKLEFTAAKHSQLRISAQELGLTPIARSKITIDKEEDNEF